MSPEPKAVIFTGTRSELDDESARVLGHMLRKARGLGFLVFVGDCPTGVDRMVRVMTAFGSNNRRVFMADWDTHGKKAGPLRNAAMVAAAVEFAGVENTVCLAFPKGASRGTRDCITQATRAGVHVRVHEVPHG